jgi:hypothetical protein
MGDTYYPELGITHDLLKRRSRIFKKKYPPPQKKPTRRHAKISVSLLQNQHSNLFTPSTTDRALPSRENQQLGKSLVIS